MKKMFSVLLPAILLSLALSAQQKHHKIVFDLVDADTASHSAVIRQFNNILKEKPDTELEVVCHGNAVNMLVKDHAVLEDKMKELKNRAKVSFKVCANSMKRLNIQKSQLIPLAEVVPVAMLELSEKQMEGWSYIRAGH